MPSPAEAHTSPVSARTGSGPSATSVDNRATLAILTEMYAAQARAKDAARAVLAHPDDGRLKEAFIEAAGGTAVISFDETIDQAVVLCLKAAETLDCAKMLVLWTTHL